MLEKRIKHKKIWEITLETQEQQQKNAEDVQMMTEKIMHTIVDYEAFVEIEESNVPVRKMADTKILNKIQKKINEKMMRL